MREFGFELALCAHLERGDRIVARQLGAHVHGRRIADTVLVDPGPDFEARASITSETIPDPLIAADAGPGRARDWTDALAVHPWSRRSKWYWNASQVLSNRAGLSWPDGRWSR